MGTGSIGAVEAVEQSRKILASILMPVFSTVSVVACAVLAMRMEISPASGV